MSRCLVLGALLARASASAAVEPPGADADVIVLENQLPEPNHDLLEESLRELLGRLELRLVAASAAPDGGVLAHVSIEPTDDAVIVSVYSTRGATTPMRYRVQQTSDELFSETLAHVILGAVEPEKATLSRVELSRVETPAEDSPPRAAPAPDAATSSAWTSRPTWWLGGRAGPILVASDRVGTALGASVGVALPAPGRPSAALEASYWLPTRITRDAVRAELSRFGGRLRARVEPLASRRAALQLGLSGGVDFVALAPRSPSPSSARRSTRLQPLVGGSLGGLLRITTDIDLVAGLGIDVELAPRRWLVVSGSEQSSFFETAQVLPYASLGFEWRIAGTAPDPPLRGP